MTQSGQPAISARSLIQLSTTASATDKLEKDFIAEILEVADAGSFALKFPLPRDSYSFPISDSPAYGRYTGLAAADVVARVRSLGSHAEVLRRLTHAGFEVSLNVVKDSNSEPLEFAPLLYNGVHVSWTNSGLTEARERSVKACALIELTKKTSQALKEAAETGARTATIGFSSTDELHAVLRNLRDAGLRVRIVKRTKAVFSW